ncbi:MAG: TIGR04282 family arsenosugar biosynthesis glycosyltransferase [Smithellaceae bacterium]|nr:TIGR04282 family arsenosugar biosynthesis glycosyltransferase [Smithellaceae bacterium]
MNDHCLIVFARYPEQGKVKTRLLGDLPEEAVCRLYTCFVADLIEMLGGCRGHLRLAFTPADKTQEIKSCFPGCRSYLPQVGSDLGERMREAFQACFAEGFAKAILIGSDCPDLPADIVTMALGALEELDAVIGPAYDGGYYLIGFRRERFLPTVFSGIPWGEKEVFGLSLERIKNAGLKVCIAPFWRDIDTIEDLRALKRESAAARSCPRTAALLADLDLTPRRPSP